MTVNSADYDFGYSEGKRMAAKELKYVRQKAIRAALEAAAKAIRELDDNAAADDTKTPDWYCGVSDAESTVRALDPATILATLEK